MPQFLPGVAKTAIAPIVAKPSGMNCEAELFLGPNEVTKVATSGRVPFTSTGVAKGVSLPITMPSSPGSYHGYIDVFTAGTRFLAYQTTEDIIIAAPVADIRVENLNITPSEVSVGGKITINCIAKNYGTAAGSKTITCTVS